MPEELLHQSYFIDMLTEEQKRLYQAHTHREIVICPECKGSGKTYHHHHEDIEPYTEVIDCHLCEGKGRVIKVTYHTKMV